MLQLGSELVETIRNALQYTPQGFSLNLPSTLIDEIDEQLVRLIGQSSTDQLTLLVPSDIRPAVRHVTQCRPGVIVLGFDEIVQGTTIQTSGLIEEPVLSAS